MKRTFAILLVVAALFTMTAGVFADPSYGSDEPFNVVPPVTTT